MHLVRCSLLFAAFGLVAAATLVAQGPPPAALPSKPAPKVWTDADLDQLMKEVGATVGALRKAIDGTNAELAKTNADKMEELFEQVDDFWTARNVKDAAEFADDAAEYAERIEDAIDAKDFAKATENAKLLQGMCGTCHSKYRDKGPDGGYRIKP